MMIMMTETTYIFIQCKRVYVCPNPVRSIGRKGLYENGHYSNEQHGKSYTKTHSKCQAYKHLKKIMQKGKKNDEKQKTETTEK